MTRTARKIAVPAIAALLAATTAPAALADTAGVPGTRALTTSEVASARAFLSAYDVPADTQDALLSELDSGDIWDSLTGGPAVSTRTVTTPTEIGSVTTYEDGSIAVTTIEKAARRPSDGSGSQTVDGCTTSGEGTVNRTLTNCKVRSTVGLITMSFSISYKYTYGSLSDPWVKSASITRAPYDVAATTLGASFSELSAAITRAVAGTGAPAMARATMNVTTLEGTTTRTCWLQLNIPIGGYALAYSTDEF